MPDACILQGCRGVEQHMWARMCCAYCFSSWPNPVGDALCDNLPGAEGHCRHVTFLDCRAQIEIRKRDGRHKSCIAQDRVQPHRHPIVDVIEVDLTERLCFPRVIIPLLHHGYALHQPHQDNLCIASKHYAATCVNTDLCACMCVLSTPTCVPVCASRLYPHNPHITPKCPPP